MPRAAGNKPGYTFHLYDENTGKHRHAMSIELPSVTTIIKRTLASPMLMDWMYRCTRDFIAGALSMVDPNEVDPDSLGEHDAPGINAIRNWDLLTDADVLEEWLKENRLRPNDWVEMRAEEGQDRHDFLEKLGKAYLEAEPETAMMLAKKKLDDPDGWVRGIAQWWVDREPNVIASESVLPCIKHGYCGSVDLVYRDGPRDEEVVVCDLKTRKPDSVVWDSDKVQVPAYRLAWDLLHPEMPSTKGTVLLVTADGKYHEEPITLSSNVFLNLKAAHDEMRRQA